LRILQQTMFDFERFYKAAAEKYRENTDAMATALRLIFALSFEFRSGRISEADLQEGRGVYASVLHRMGQKDDAPPAPMRVAANRYSIVDIDDALFSNEFLVEFIVRGN